MLDGKFAEGKLLTIIAESDQGRTTEFQVAVRIDTPQEILYYQNGGILEYVLRRLAAKG
jgi:aconitate hydratase